MATKDSKLKNPLVDPDHESSISKNEEPDVQKAAGIKNIISKEESDSGIKKAVSKEEESDVDKAAGIKNVLVIASDDQSSTSKQDVEKEVDLGICMDKLNLGPKKKLLVLPMGGFLVHRAHVRRLKTIPKNRRFDFRSGNFMIYKRPFCEEFLRFCFERFEVGIWSSAMEHNIGEVLTNLMGEMRKKLLFTWDQSECTETDFMCLDNKYKPLFLKELDQLWRRKHTCLLPWRDGEYSSSNTLLIADPVKALLNPPNTGIFPKDYDPMNTQDDFLGPNGELRVFLDGLADAKDVQTYVKAHRIGEPAITSYHPDWGFYSKIIRLYGK